MVANFAQARAQPGANWVASEIRGDRIHQNCSRLRAAPAPNLAILDKLRLEMRELTR